MPLSEVMGMPGKRAPVHDPLLGKELGGVRLTRVIAEGGMGRVYEGIQEKPKRAVAVKVMRPGVATPEMIRRFAYEAEILGRLRHPGIAHIFAAGVHDEGGVPIPFFIMEFIPDARSLTRHADDSCLSVRARLTVFKEVCDAVAHGHQKGVIHRDLKPGNILVESSGQPKVIDFGVAKVINPDAALTTMMTHAGEILGTLQYMAPEQLTHRAEQIDARCDVYALGVVLYELLTTAMPYDIRGKPLQEVMRVVREQEPTPISCRNNELSGPISVMVAKCLQKNPKDRYPDAGELSQDVSRYLTGVPIKAVPPSLLQICLRIARKHRNPIVIGTAVIALSAAIVVGSMRLVDDDQSLLIRQQYESDVSQLGSLIDAGRLDDAAALHENILSSRGSESPPIELRILQSELDNAIVVLGGHAGPVSTVAFNSDATQIATTSLAKAADVAVGYNHPGTESPSGIVRLWDISRGRLQFDLRGHILSVTTAAYSPNGRTLATASADRTVRLWDTASGKERAVLEGHTNWVTTLCFLEENRLVTGSRDSTVCFWDLHTGALIGKPLSFPSWIYALRVSSTGDTLAIGCLDGKVYLHDISKRIKDRAVEGIEGSLDNLLDTNMPQSIDFSDVGHRFAAVRSDAPAQLWDPRLGKHLADLSRATCLTFDPTGMRIALAYKNQVEIRASEDGALLETIVGENDREDVLAIKFSPDGNELALATSNGRLLVWVFDERGGHVVLHHGHRRRLNNLAYSPDGRLIATASDDGTGRLWDAEIPGVSVHGQPSFSRKSNTLE